MHCIKYYSVDVLLKHDFLGCQYLEKWLENIMYRTEKTIIIGTALNNMLSNKER